jgi:hypothetical protein
LSIIYHGPACGISRNTPFVKEDGEVIIGKEGKRIV